MNQSAKLLQIPPLKIRQLSLNFAVRWCEVDHITEAFNPYLGYNADETKRAGKADGYICQGHPFLYPLHRGI